MSYLSKMSLRNRSLIALATIAILLIGAFVIPTLKEELFPSLEFPAISVITVYPGASPSIVEQDVTDPLEQSIQSIQGIQQITSTSSEGLSVIEVQYSFGTDIDSASQTLTQQINRVQVSLPSGVTPQVQTFNVNELPVIQLAVTSSEDTATLATDIKNTVEPALQGINGVANVNVTGVHDQIVTITLDPSKLQKEGVTASQVQSVLQANNTTLPAGELTNNGQTLAIRVGNTFNSIQDLQKVVVGEHVTTIVPPGCPQISTSATRTSQSSLNFFGARSQSAACTPKTTVTPVALKDVATVQQTLAPSTTLTRTNGKDSLGISITKTNDGNTVSISQQVRQLIPSLQSKLGHNAQITIVSDQAPTITTAVSSLVREGLIGAAFAILVILVFLFSLRSMLVTAVSIPLSIVIALIGLYVGNYSLNILTLGGLTIAIGRVVDDSIVVLENIYRHLRMGEDKQTAVSTAVKEVAGAVTASTLTTVSVFLPIAFVGGLVGELFGSFAVAITIALLASLLVALTVIPVLAYWFLKAPAPTKQAAASMQHDEARSTQLERGYVPLVRWVTRHRAITIIAALVIFAGTIALIPRIGTNFISPSSSNTYSINLRMPVSTSLDSTNKAAQRIEAVLNGTPHVQEYQVTVGSGGGVLVALAGGSGGNNTATFSITSDPNADQTSFQQTLQNRLNTLTGVGTLTFSASGNGFNSSTIDVNVQSSNQQTLRQAAQQVLATVKQVSNTTDVSSNLVDNAPLINVQIDPQKALSYGLTAAQVGQSLREVYTGATVTTVTFNGQQIHVNLLLGTPVTTINAMNNLLIPTQTGTVKLGSLATITQVNGPTQITHSNGVQTATISATVTSQNTGAVSAAIQSKINSLKLPDGVTVSLGGVTSNQSQAFSSLELALLVAIMLVYLVMVFTFRSLLQPLILLVSIPFAATGSLLLLLATRTPLGAPSLIGLLMLVGIVVTNAIVLLDLINQYRQKGMDVHTAVVEGGRRRLRPILMTAIATILALMPMALGLSPSSGFIAAPLAITVIGGLTSSTVLTLLLVPTLYVMMEGRRYRSSKNGKQPEEQKPVQLAQPEQQEQIPFPVAAGRAEPAMKRDRALLGLSLALLAQEVQQPEADPQVLATLSSAVSGHYPSTWSAEQTGKAIAHDILEPLSIKLLTSSVSNGEGK